MVMVPLFFQGRDITCPFDITARNVRTHCKSGKLMHGLVWFDYEESADVDDDDEQTYSPCMEFTDARCVYAVHA